MRQLMAVRDIKLDSFIEFVVYPNVPTCMRALTRRVNSGSSEDPVAIWPEDFELWSLGQVDDKTGDIEPATTKVCRCLDLQIREEA